MKQIILILTLLCISVAGAQVPSDEMLDSKFLALIEWSVMLNAGATEYNKTVVYVPTETNLPILEATRHNGQ